MRSPSSALVAPFNRLVYSQILTRWTETGDNRRVLGSESMVDATEFPSINLRVPKAACRLSLS
ncbi:hypothetical protein TNCV_1738051 [Trichonephila clavipes]|nr:hypothetical protein TNCV_1738051 [Trichonephila clavipes]